MTNEQLIALAEKCGAHYYRGGAYPGGILFYPGSHLKTFAAALAAAPATKADSTEALRAALQAYVRFDETCGNLKDKLYVQAQKALAATPEAPSHSAPSEPTDEQIAVLKNQYGVTSSGRGVKEFHQVAAFARAVLDLRAALPEAQAKPASATAEPTCLGDPGECNFNEACMYQCQGEQPRIPGEPAQAAEPEIQISRWRPLDHIKDDEDLRLFVQESIRLALEEAAEPRQAPSDALDAARYRLIVEDACSNSGEFVTVQPSGYNGGDHVWIEFGFKHPKWTGFDKSHIDAAVDAAIAAQEQKEPKS